MGKYVRDSRSLSDRVKHPHPIWRGIGCFVVLIIPILSYGLAVSLVDYALKIGTSIPVELLGYPVVADWLFGIPGLISFFSWVQSQPNLYAYLLGTFLMILLVSGIFSVFYSMMYRFIGPPRYTPLDAPPPKRKVKKYRR